LNGTRLQKNARIGGPLLGQVAPHHQLAPLANFAISAAIASALIA
jgi:hypothetical protein